MSRSRIIAALFVLVFVLLSGSRFDPLRAACIPIPNTSIVCNDDPDSVNIVGSTLNMTVNAGGGNDTITIDSTSRVGNNSTDPNDGVAAGAGADSVINSGIVIGQTGIQDGDVSVDSSADYIANYGTIQAFTGISGGDQDILVNFNSINALYGIECFDAVSSGCYMTNFSFINASNSGFEGSSLGDVALNTGQLGNINLGGGNDSLLNGSNGIVTGYVQVGTGNDTITNQGSILGAEVNLYYGDDSLNNAGTGTLTTARIVNGVLGDTGNDTIINGSLGYMGGIEGGDGNDSLVNSSLVAGAMLGGIGNDTVTVAPGGLANYINGDDGDDSVSNRAFVNSTVEGGIGNDTVTNFAGASATEVSGFNGDDRVLNAGFVNANLNGGAGNDSVVNFAGAFVSQIYGESGNDTVINGGYLLGSAWGGAENDIVVNLGGAQATHLYGEDGSDSVFNGGYLVGGLYGGLGNDTLVNAAFAFAQAADLGDGDDQYTNGGWLNSALQCGAGNDTVSVGGRIEGGINCDAGNDLVYIFNGVVAGQGAAVIGTINGGPGSDGLGFAFTVNVGSQAAADAIGAAIAAASPAGGTITIGALTYTWTNFEALYNLLSFTIGEDVVITIPVTRRVNASDAAAPVAIYCAAGGVELWTIGADGQGSFAFSVPHADIATGTTVSAGGVTLESTAGGSFSVNATASDGKPYSFTGSC